MLRTSTASDSRYLAIMGRFRKRRLPEFLSFCTLTPYFSTASAYFANGSFIDIAKIEGGEVYKSYMLDPQQKFTKTTTTTASYCLLPKQLCQYWPFQDVSIEDLNPLTPMLKGLFGATEATLETNTHSAVVAAYAMGDFDNGRKDLRSASDALGVTTYD